MYWIYFKTLQQIINQKSKSYIFEELKFFNILDLPCD